MSAMSAAGLRLRLCPFCGSEAEMLRLGPACAVYCANCGAKGPEGLVMDFIEPDENLADDSIWEKRTLQAEGAALRGWNSRPWIGSVYPDEEEEMRKGFRIDEDKL